MLQRRIELCGRRTLSAAAAFTKEFMPKFRSWSSVDACPKVPFGALTSRHRGSDANIHVFPLISAFFLFIDFEAFTVQFRPSNSTLLKYEIEPQFKSSSIFRTDVGWPRESS